MPSSSAAARTIARPRPMPEAALAGGVADLVELLEDRLQLVLGDADAGVPDLDPELRRHAGGQPSRTCRPGCT